jgi:acyl dehydratase
MIGHGVYFDDYKVGVTYQTLGRTISETDIVNFVNLGGFTEPLFMDMEYVKKESLFGARMAPGVMTFAMSEGLVMQTGLIHGVGMAWLGGEVKVTAPVLAGDTIRVEVEIVDKRETKKPDRGIVTYKHRVLNQRGETVMELTLQRMIKRKTSN